MTIEQGRVFCRVHFAVEQKQMGRLGKAFEQMSLID